MASQVHEPESLKEDVQTDAVLTRILSIEKKWIKIPEVVKQILGHADIATTLNIYTHPDTALLVANLEKIQWR